MDERHKLFRQRVIQQLANPDELDEALDLEPWRIWPALVVIGLLLATALLALQSIQATTMESRPTGAAPTSAPRDSAPEKSAALGCSEPGDVNLGRVTTEQAAAARIDQDRTNQDRTHQDRPEPPGSATSAASSHNSNPDGEGRGFAPTRLRSIDAALPCPCADLAETPEPSGLAPAPEALGWPELLP